MSVSGYSDSDFESEEEDAAAGVLAPGGGAAALGAEVAQNGVHTLESVAGNVLCERAMKTRARRRRRMPKRRVSSARRRCARRRGRTFDGRS